jgi:hypothetical protein
MGAAHPNPAAKTPSKTVQPALFMASLTRIVAQVLARFGNFLALAGVYLFARPVYSC